MVLVGKSSQEYPVKFEVPQDTILGPKPFLLYINDLMMLSVILLSMLADEPTLCLKVIRHLICNNNYNWLLNWNLIYSTVDLNRKWLVSFNVGKIQLVCLTGLITLLLYY